MRNRNQWEAEIDLLRRLDAMPSREKREQAESLELTADSLPSAAGGSHVREDFMAGTGDRILLRDGRFLVGQWMGSQPSRYQWRFPDGQIRWIDKSAVQLWWRGQQTDGPAPMPPGRKAVPSAPVAQVAFLPQSTFGPDLLEGLKKAKKKIMIATYNLSEGLYGPLEEIYDVLSQKVEEGVEVVLVTEFGPGTSAFLKRSVLNFASTLTTSGIQVRFMQEYKVMHKKLIVVDTETVWMGSANLTTAGLSVSNESNIRVREPTFASQAAEDFERLLTLALPLSELKY
jgi:phosphatidylserine/phosphatidylglycerophosphate/cardiolipin synthase-like enzyme